MTAPRNSLLAGLARERSMGERRILTKLESIEQIVESFCYVNML